MTIFSYSILIILKSCKIRSFRWEKEKISYNRITKEIIEKYKGEIIENYNRIVPCIQERIIESISLMQDLDKYCEEVNKLFYKRPNLADAISRTKSQN